MTRIANLYRNGIDFGRGQSPALAGGATMNSLSFQDIEDAIGGQCTYEVDRITVGQQRRHVEAKATAGTGRFWVHNLRPGLTLTISDFTAEREIAGTAQFGAGLFLMGLLQGDARTVRCGGAPVKLVPGMCSAVYLKEPADLSSITPRGAREQMVCVQASIDWLQSCDLDIGTLSRDVIEVYTLPLRSWVSADLSRLSQRWERGPIELMFAESCALGLIASAVDAQKPGAALDPQTLEKMAAVRRLMESDPCVQHSLLTLSGAVGISVTRLKTDFPKAYGTTAFGYLRKLRLEAARSALVAQRWTIAEAAYAVGFGHPASFSTAFRRHFGYPPSDLVKN